MLKPRICIFALASESPKQDQAGDARPHSAQSRVPPVSENPVLSHLAGK